MSRTLHPLSFFSPFSSPSLRRNIGDTANWGIGSPENCSMSLRQEIWNNRAPEGLEFREERNAANQSANCCPLLETIPSMASSTRRDAVFVPSIGLTAAFERLIESNRGYDTRTVPRDRRARCQRIDPDRSNVANYWIPRDRVVDRDARELGDPAELT